MEYDVIVIGGGPAGMMAAGRAAECGARVLLLEKNKSLGEKLRITGGGRCNVTNAEFDVHLFLSHFKTDAKFLYSSFAQFGVQDTLDFFHRHNMPTKVEAEKRVFPCTDNAESVFTVLKQYMMKEKVMIRTQSSVKNIIASSHHIEGIILENNEKIRAHSYIIATGGKSHPETGSTGDGFLWLKDLGHTIINPQAVLVPIVTREEWTHKLSGVSVSDAKLSFFHIDEMGRRRKISPSKTGKILFTHFGLSGPLILNMSKLLGEFLSYGQVILSLDLLSDMDYKNIDELLQSIFENNKNKKIKNVLSEFIPSVFVSALLENAHIDKEKEVHNISREERIKIGRVVKDMQMTVTELLGSDKAIVTSGGVDLREVDFKTMCSRLYPNLYLIGDTLNIDRPSGGYSLQLCWTTGFVAGSAVAKVRQSL